MDRPHARVRSWLIIDAGFSKQNADIALQMWRHGELLELEAKVIGKAMTMQPNPHYPSKPWELTPTIGSATAERILNPLNYRITNEHGGRARSGPNRG